MIQAPQSLQLWTLKKPTKFKQQAANCSNFHSRRGVMSHTTTNPDTATAYAPITAELQRTGRYFSTLQTVVLLFSPPSCPCPSAPASVYFTLPQWLLQWWSSLSEQIHWGFAEESRLGKTNCIYYKYSGTHSESNTDSVKILAELSQILLFNKIIISN